jgi:hypothetical protein
MDWFPFLTEKKTHVNENPLSIDQGLKLWLLNSVLNQEGIE